jgi:hypothetical protein
VKRLRSCANCGATEGPQIYASDPWCSEGCKQVYEAETAYLQEALSGPEPPSVPLAAPSRYTEMVEALRDATTDLQECRAVLAGYGQDTTTLGTDIARFHILLVEVEGR